ncbi:twin-arginine translocase TatA/TatE family subunit [Altererythrobacter sp. Root672]|uniref:twin-arginine translocase TatA/TatE family subunit n=1 Tax=Altererythrobacter sp. Root672 TaxID=1736584 RepID=UPI0006FF9878|nr:preprotein translocase subunit TatA [Altererythrobacter sp. Root672]
MSIGLFQILIIALVILVLFGRGRISEMMGDFGKGVKSFRQGVSEDDATPAAASELAAEGPNEEGLTAEAAAEPQPADKTAG